MAKHKKKQTTPKATTENQLQPKSTKLSIIELLKKIFTVKILSLIFAVLAVIIAAISLYRSDMKDKKEDARINEEYKQKYLEEMDNSHENLFLSFDCFPLMKEIYNIDIILPSESDFGIFQSLYIRNEGRKTAKNTDLTICINNECEFGVIFPSIKDEVKDTIFPGKNFAKWELKGIKPNLFVRPIFIFNRKDHRVFQNKQEFSMCYTLTCDDKAKPFKMDINYTVHFHDTFSEYLQSINENNKYKDFAIYNFKDEKGNNAHEIYRFDKTDDGYQYSKCSSGVD